MDSVGSLIIYVVVALAIMVCSVLAVTTRKILRSATFLLFALFATAVVYFMLGYQFLGAVQIAVYAGGIVVLFVFAILLTSHPGDNAKSLASKRRTIGCVAAVATFIVCVWSLISRFSAAINIPEMQTHHDMKLIGETMMGTGNGQYLLPFEAISVLLLACIIGGIVVARKKND